MPTLNIDLDFFEHRKVRRLVSLAGRGSEANLLRLWCYCGRFHAEDGLLADYSAEEIEQLTAWGGKPGGFVEALVKVGFLDPVGTGFQVHDWIEHQGHIAAYSKRGKAMAQARWKNANPPPPPPPKPSTQQCVQQCTGNAGANAASMLQAMPEQSRAEQSITDTTPPLIPTPIVELPTGFPDEAECQEAADLIGVPRAFALTEWNRAVGRGGVDSRGQPIASWAHHLKARWSDQQSRKSEAVARATRAPRPEDYR